MKSERMDRREYNRLMASTIGVSIDAFSGTVAFECFSRGHYVLGTVFGALTLIDSANHIGDMITGEHNSAFRLIKRYRDAQAEKNYRLF